MSKLVLTKQQKELIKRIKDARREDARRIKESIHSSHKMTRWGSDIVTIGVTPRFGQSRYCKKCGGYHVKAYTQKVDYILTKPCIL